MTRRVKALTRPALLIWARESAGFSLPEAAAKLHMEDTRLAAWEAGDDTPTIPQLRNLADLYK